MEGLKEYLNTVTHEYKCFGGVPKGPDWIEIPEGAEDFRSNGKFYKDNGGRFFSYIKEWLLSEQSGRHTILWQRKPTQKKEYLVPQNAGGYMFRTAYDNGWIPDSWIEVPEGAECLLFLKNVEEYRFTKMVGLNVYSFNPYREKDWYVSPVYDVVTGTSQTRVLWQRPTLPEALPFIDDEPPAYYGNAIRPKPRKRVYAVLGYEVIPGYVPCDGRRIEMPDEWRALCVADDCIRVPKPSADYLFNTFRAMLKDDFVSKDQKECVLHHLNYLKVY